jgi:heme exporter protein D
MSTVAAYLSMGGYAAFVWPAYAVAVIVLGGLAIGSWRSYRRAARSLERLQPNRPIRE